MFREGQFSHAETGVEGASDTTDGRKNVLGLDDVRPTMSDSDTVEETSASNRNAESSDDGPKQVDSPNYHH
jgi:hypothetical protein